MLNRHKLYEKRQSLGFVQEEERKKKKKKQNYIIYFLIYKFKNILNIGGRIRLGGYVNLMIQTQSSSL